MIKIELNFPQNFLKMWRKCGLNDDDLDDFREKVINFEKQRESSKDVFGRLIKGTGGAIKVRYSGNSQTKGKSGSNRIIYCSFTTGRDGLKVYHFLLCYSKSFKETLTKKEKNALKATIQKIKKK